MGEAIGTWFMDNPALGVGIVFGIVVLLALIGFLHGRKTQVSAETRKTQGVVYLVVGVALGLWVFSQANSAAGQITAALGAWTVERMLTWVGGLFALLFTVEGLRKLVATRGN
jgi:hypothetical protein